jgi:hypothetical protein
VISTFWIIVGVVLVAMFAFALRRMGEDRGALAPPPAVPEPGESKVGSRAEVLDDEDDDEHEDDAEDVDIPEGMIAVTSDGLAFVPRPHGVLITIARKVHAARTGEDAPVFPGAGAHDPEHFVPVMMNAGDLIAARVRRGAPNLDPWRLETLGRDRDLTAWVFEVQEAAEAARELLEARVVQPPRDDLGDPIPVGDEDFWVAERELEQTLADLDREDAIDDEPRR